MTVAAWFVIAVLCVCWVVFCRAWFKRSDAEFARKRAENEDEVRNFYKKYRNS